MQTIVVTSISGVSGAGVTPKPMYHLPHATENVQAYGYPGHRHTPEIEQGLTLLSGQEAPPVTFSPHLAPMSRGILTHASAAAVREMDQEELVELYRSFYKDSPFVRVLSDRLPDTKSVTGTNFCDLAPRYDGRAKRITVTSVIDNLVKGAAGQAIQNMNVRFGLAETAGLLHPALSP